MCAQKIEVSWLTVAMFAAVTSQCACTQVIAIYYCCKLFYDVGVYANLGDHALFKFRATFPLSLASPASGALVLHLALSMHDAKDYYREPFSPTNRLLTSFTIMALLARR